MPDKSKKRKRSPIHDSGGEEKEQTKEESKKKMSDKSKKRKRSPIHDSGGEEKEQTREEPKQKKSEDNQKRKSSKESLQDPDTMSVHESEEDIISPTPAKQKTTTLQVAMFRKRTPRKPKRREAQIVSSESDEEVKRKVKKKRNRKLTVCRECGVAQLNIWRHMIKTHDSSFSTAKSKRPLKTKRGYIIYRCPAMKRKAPRFKCNKVVKRLHDHLVKVHHIQVGSYRLKKLIEKAEPVEAESGDSIKEESSEEEEVDQLAPTQVVVAEIHSEDKEKQKAEPNTEREKKQETDFFFQSHHIKLFMKFLRDTGEGRDTAMNMGARAYVTWKQIDSNVSLEGLVNIRNIEKYIGHAFLEGRTLQQSEITTMIEFIKFLLLCDLIPEADHTPAQTVIEKLTRTLFFILPIKSEKTTSSTTEKEPILLIASDSEADKPTHTCVPIKSDIIDNSQIDREIIFSNPKAYKKENLNFDSDLFETQDANSPETMIITPSAITSSTTEKEPILLISSDSEADKPTHTCVPIKSDIIDNSQIDREIIFSNPKAYEKENLNFDSDLFETQDAKSPETMMMQEENPKEDIETQDTKSKEEQFRKEDNIISVDSDTEKIISSNPKTYEQFQAGQTQEKRLTLKFNRNKIDEDPMGLEFKEWLVGPSNMIPEKTAKQHVFQAFSVWYAMSRNHTILELLQREALNAWYLMITKTMAPGTVVSYIGSTIRLFEFLVDNGHIQDMVRGQRCVEQLKRLRKMTSRKKKERQSHVQTKAIQNLITPNEISSFLNCKVVRDIHKLADKFETSEKVMEVSPKEWYDTRDLLLLRLIQCNAQRPGAVSSITENTLDKAKVTEDGWAILTVGSHKTAETHGPANLAVPPEIYRILKTFIKMCKATKNFITDKNRQIFTCYPKQDGTITPLNSSQINNGINRIWAKGPNPKPISATRFRKSTTTHVRRAKPAIRQQLAAHMTHQAKTADQFYELFEHHENAETVGKTIATIMEPTITRSIHWPKEKATDKNSDDTESYEYEHREFENTDTGVEGEKAESEDVYSGDLPPPSPLNDLNLAKTEIESEAKDTKHGRRSFPPGEANELITICDPLIRTNKVKKNSVMQHLNSTDQGRRLVLALYLKYEGKDFWKSIVDRVHVERKRRQKLSKS